MSAARVVTSGQMTAAVLYGSENLRIEQIAIPQLSPDEVLVRVKVALTDGTDLKVWRRGYHARMLTPPALFGHELAGEIAALGTEVRGFLGYAGWTGGQLEGELKQKAWVVAPIESPAFRAEQGEDLWKQLLGHVKPDLFFQADGPEDPTVN